MTLVSTLPSVRTIAKERGVDLNPLLGILKLRRPDGSKTEEDFVETLEKTLGPDAQSDNFGNLWIIVGDNPTTMWSCHTDTVSAAGGHQNVTWDGDILRLHDGKPGQSLGADDGAGLWLLLELIAAKKPGLYIFHRAEEVGGKGSSFIVQNDKKLFEGIKRSIAFDRRGTTSIITRQGFERTCSDSFAQAVADALNEVEPTFAYKLDDTGTFTDTKNYADDIAECTNISVGYDHEHGPRESLDVMHLLNLRDAVLEVDFEAIETAREPGDSDEDFTYSYGWGGSGNGYTRKKSDLEELILRRAYTLAQIWEESGYTAADIDKLCDDFWNRPVAVNDDEDEFVNVLFCNECCDQNPPWASDDAWNPGDKCPTCGSIDTEVFELRADQLDTRF